MASISGDESVAEEIGNFLKVAINKKLCSKIPSGQCCVIRSYKLHIFQIRCVEIARKKSTDKMQFGFGRHSSMCIWLSLEVEFTVCLVTD